MAAEFATLSALMPPSEHNSTLCAITYDVTFRTTWTTKRKTPRNSSSDPRVKASEEQIARYLEGNWQEDLLFVLKQEQEGYEFCQQQMAERDRQLEQYLQQREDRSQGASLPKEARKGRLVRRKENKPAFALRAELFRITGTDLTQVDGIDVVTATTILS